MFTERNAQESRRRDASGNTAGSEGRRQSARHGREKGIRVFIPAAELEAAGFDPDGDPPPYTVQAVNDRRRTRATILVRLYPS